MGAPLDELLANTRPLTAPLSSYIISCFFLCVPYPPGLSTWMENKKKKRVYKSLKLN